MLTLSANFASFTSLDNHKRAVRKQKIFFSSLPVTLPVCQVLSIFRLLIILNFITSDINCPFQTDLEAGEESQTWSFSWRLLCPIPGNLSPFHWNNRTGANAFGETKSPKTGLKHTLSLLYTKKIYMQIWNIQALTILMNSTLGLTAINTNTDHSKTLKKGKILRIAHYLVSYKCRHPQVSEQNLSP